MNDEGSPIPESAPLVPESRAKVYLSPAGIVWTVNGSDR
jgi:hypothetical protein